MKKLFYILISVIMTLSLCACDMFTTHIPSAPIGEYTADELTVHFLDVGQADCQIITLPNGQVMMIDAGNNDDSDLICDYLDNLGIEKIDYLIGTHPHEDHIGSLDSVINNYEIGECYMPDAEADTKTFRDVQKALSDKKLGVTVTEAGTVIYDDGLVKAVAVAPVKAYSDLNNASIVIRLTYNKSSFLFTGDAEEKSEKDITADVSADVLSVGHHGSSTSTSDSFLFRVDPMYAVISCGKNNDYGHPHTETLEKLENDDITLYRTDTMGTIICTTKGNGAADYTWSVQK